MTYSYLLFDLDGTISDPLEGIWRSINYALESKGYEACSKQAVCQFIGPPLDEYFPAITGSNDKDELAGLITKYRERFFDVGYSENELYPGIKEALATLQKSGVILGLCTYKRQDYAEKIIRMFGLYDNFEFISGGIIGAKKSQQIATLLANKTISRNTLMIGDRATDLVSAHQNSITSAGVLWGYGSKEELESESPKYLLSSPAELDQFSGSGQTL